MCSRLRRREMDKVSLEICLCAGRIVEGSRLALQPQSISRRLCKPTQDVPVRGRHAETGESSAWNFESKAADSSLVGNRPIGRAGSVRRFQRYATCAHSLLRQCKVRSGYREQLASLMLGGLSPTLTPRRPKLLAIEKTVEDPPITNALSFPS